MSIETAAADAGTTLAEVPTEALLDHDALRRAPKVLLHEHLDGGLRPATLVELSAEIGHALPTTDADELGTWFQAAADSGSLETYLTTFDHTIAVMQTREGLARVAREAVLDLAEDGVVYAELRYAPEQHLTRGLSLDEVVLAVQEGIDQGVVQAAADGRTIRIGTLLTGMRHADRSLEMAQLTLDHRGDGVVGYDIAGAELGFPATNPLAAFDLLRRASMPFTIHAGEADGVRSMWEAVQLCGTHRVGHGVRIMDDIELDPTGARDDEGRPLATLSPFAAWVRDRRVVLEVCPSSNLQTTVWTTIPDHPITVLRDLGFTVTINNDNRLMSATSASREMALLVDQAGWGAHDLRKATLDALEASFLPLPEREALARDVVVPGWAGLL